MLLNFNLVNSRAVALGKTYKETLIKIGGSDKTEVGEDGIARRVFNPWLADMSVSDRERIANIIISAVETGNPLKTVAKELKKIPAMSGCDTESIAYQETKFLYTAGTMQRFKEEKIREGIWHTTDIQEKEHFVLDRKVFDLNNPVWNMLYMEGCKCWCEPVVEGRTAVDKGKE